MIDNPLYRLLRCKLERRCMFCQYQGTGHRFLDMRDFRLLKTDKFIAPELELECAQILSCINACKELDFDPNNIRQSLMNSLEPMEPSMLFELNSLFAANVAPKYAGIPSCWKLCCLALPFHDAIQDSICDQPFDVGYMSYCPVNYDKLLGAKAGAAREAIAKECREQLPPTEVISSPIRNFRHKCRFAVEQQGDEIDFMIWESNGRPSLKVSIFPIASMLICQCIDLLKKCLKDSQSLRENLSSVHLLSTLAGHCIVRLLYDHRVFDDQDKAVWMQDAESAREYLVNSLCTINSGATHPSISSASPSSPASPSGHVPIISVLARAKNVKLVCGSDRIQERFVLADGRQLSYLHSAEGFSNPNAEVNVKCLNWLCSIVQGLPCGRGGSRGKGGNAGSSDTVAATTATSHGPAEVTESQTLQDCSSLECKHDLNCEEQDLLELYCGMGNHTVALAGFVNRIVAVEICDALCKTAEENLLANNITNVSIVKGDSHDFTKRMLKRGSYLDKAGNHYSFGAVLVDPPRSGLDDCTRSLVTHYKYIIYISCNYNSLARDLQLIGQTHEVVRFAVFDQFAYTSHVESAVLLQMRDGQSL